MSAENSLQAKLIIVINKDASKLQPYFDDANITPTGVKVSTDQPMQSGKIYKFNYWIAE